MEVRTDAIYATQYPPGDELVILISLIGSGADTGICQWSEAERGLERSPAKSQLSAEIGVIVAPLRGAYF